ncbi:protein-methionine-sulfoxide reductase heme-binding subunit MsrQ [Motilimonas cestriensis]|uniref:Protein-methionine-sulfoxide reductase heme-binding subunit MsrQ n=1 Tax=Motilimonas cestriensis TaxID=2742685 RepID=A0ABS8W9Q6_9GAMM|nr:protein-methionine-sulfoxide reductase heme-binding subunit MsrQ [Motilimonas cestriensis]MCE2594529.1 protein-methionine-sulfoxide reductase heme-binding subunit MsrQ [Motilimonas cestriensis]
MVKTWVARHISTVKVMLHGAALLPLCWLAWQTFSQQLGGDPVQYLTHFTGKGALNLLFITLLISPVAKWIKWGFLLQTRRLLGLWVLAYALIHVGIFWLLDLAGRIDLFVEEVIKRPYITLGLIALLLLIALGITSANRIRRKMGRNWQKLHNWVYLIVLLVPIHYYWSVKSAVFEPTIYLIIAALLLLLRRQKLMAYIPKKIRPKVA